MIRTLIVVWLFLCFPGLALPLAAAVDINRAGPAELAALPGMSPDLAARILAWREKNGDFATPYDLMKVPGMSGEIFQSMLPAITAGEGAANDASTVPDPGEVRPARPEENEAPPPSGETQGPRRIGRAPLTPVSLFKAGFGLARRGKFSMAEPLFRQFLEQHPTHALVPDARFLLAACLEEQEKYTLALELYGELATMDGNPLQAIALLRSGICQDLMEKRADAVRIYKDFLTRSADLFLQSQWRQSVQERLEALNPQ